LILSISRESESGICKAKIGGERIGADRRAIEELDLVGETIGADLTLLLEIYDRVDKRCT